MILYFPTVIHWLWYYIINYSEPSESCQSESAESADECEAIPQSGALEIEFVSYNSTTTCTTLSYFTPIHAVYRGSNGSTDWRSESGCEYPPVDATCTPGVCRDRLL